MTAVQASMRMLCEDADPYHLYDLVEAEMFLRAGAVRIRAHAHGPPPLLPPITCTRARPAPSLATDAAPCIQVFKRRSKLSEHALKLIEEMERHEEREGRPKSGLTEAPFGDLWGDELEEMGGALTVRHRGLTYD